MEAFGVNRASCPAPNENMLTVNVRKLCGERCRLEMCFDASVKDVARDLPPDKFNHGAVKLFHKGKQLQGTDLVRNLHLQAGEYLTCVPRKGRQKKEQETSGSVAMTEMQPGSTCADVWKELQSELQEAKASSINNDGHDTAKLDANRQDIDSDVAEVSNEQSSGNLGCSLTGIQKAPGGHTPCRQNFDLEMQGDGNLGSGGRSSRGSFRLPVSLLRLEKIFGSLSTVYSFLMKNHIQATWSVVRDALRGLCHDETVGDDDIISMAEIASDIVAVREGVSCTSVAGPKDAWDVQAPSPPKKQSSFVETNKLRGILQNAEGNSTRDGFGTILEGDAKNLIIELFTPVRKAESIADGMEEEGFRSKPCSRRGYQPRKKAFRGRLLMAVHQLHDEFLQRICLTESANQIETTQSGQAKDWHPQFDVGSITVKDAVQAAERAANKGSQSKSSIGGDLSTGPARPPRVLCQSVGCSSCADLKPTELLDHIKRQDWYQNQIVHEESFPSRDPCFSDLQHALSTPVRHAIESAGIQRLFSHQAEAIEGLLSGKDVVISTSTASGKSLCYNIPVLEALVRNPGACALYIFPTKALAQDQLRALRGFCKSAFGDAAPCVEVYDGDTGFERRREIRNRAQLLITNPDMLHLSILPVFKDFSRLLSNLALVVVDEGHAYKGVFGCHTAMVIRRLRRVCQRQYGVVPRFVMTSATMANPKEHMQALIGIQDVLVVSTDGSPHGAKIFALWNPPLRTQHQQEAPANRKLNKRAQQERSRHYQREANQVRGRGSQLSHANGMTKAEWIQAVAVSKKRGILEESGPQTPQGPGKRKKEDQARCEAVIPSKPSNPTNVQAALDSVQASDHRRKRPLIIKGSRTSNTETGVSNDFEARLPGPEWKGRTKSSGITDDKRRNSPMVEISLLLVECIQHGLRTIAFCMTRKLCELVTAYTREMLKASAPHLADSLRVYRGGYSPEERREIEVGLFHGTLRAVAATNALELGIDVGDLDATLHLGFPGSAASLWQQSGRAGRREQTSLSIYIAFDGPLDQYFMKHPSHLFGRPIERVQVDANNVHILKDHVTCAAKELPIEHADKQYFGPLLEMTTRDLAKAGDLCQPPTCEVNCGIWKYSGSARNPASNVSLRAIDPERYAIVDEANDGKVLEEVEESMAFFQVYEGAVYMFQGRTHLCTRMDLEKKIAYVRAADLKYYTTTRDFTDVHVIGGSVAYPMKNQETAKCPSTSAICANAQVTTRWLGFLRIWRGSEIAFDSVDLFLPDMQFETQAVYIRVPHKLRADVKQRGLEWRAGLHAANHALLNVVPLYLTCGSGDMKTECDSPYDTRYRPERVLIYDNHPGGIGLANQVLPMMGVLLGKAYELIKYCGCEQQTGCPGCIQSTKCDEYNTILCKEAALMILKGIVLAEGYMETADCMSDVC